MSDAEAACRLELRLLDPAVRADPAALDVLLHPAFVEHGASGRRWERAATIAALVAAPALDVAVEDLVGELVAPGVVLVRYDTVRPGGRARRSSLWLADGERWRLRFHQGTPVDAAARRDG